MEVGASLRNLVLHVLRTLSAVLALSCPSEVLRQIVVHLGRNVAPFWYPILETAIDRVPPHEELAGITFHIFSVAGMILCVKDEKKADGVRTSLP